MSALPPNSPSSLLSDCITYARRILKQPNPQDISDATIADYLNRFYVFDMPARIQLFEMKTQFSLELTPNVDQYNAPITYLPGGAVVPTYNTYLTPAYIDGYQIVMQQSHDQWMKLFPNRVLNQFQQNGNGSAGPYNFGLFELPVIQGHRDFNLQPPGNTVNPLINPLMPLLGGRQEGLLTSSVYVTAIDINGNLNVAQDDPYLTAPFMTPSATIGNLIQYDPVNPGNNPSIVGTVNYITGAINVTFLNPIPGSSAINSQTIPYSAGRPQAILFFDNTFSFRPIPDKPYLFQIDAYYNPAAFLNTNNALPYRYMTEYLARGTARKILQDYGDVEQLALYEPMFREQENFVLRKTYRQNSNVRVATIFQGQTSYNPGSYNNI
jgi:hypothetical protein